MRTRSAPIRAPRLAALALALGLLLALLPTGAGAAPIPLAAFRNSVGICQHPLHQCNFDGGGFSYSSAALAAAGVRGGTTISSDGFTFTWPSTGAGEVDNVEAAGQRIPVLPGGATRIGLLGASHNGPVTATVKLHYTSLDEDGDRVDTVVEHPLTLSDWTLNAGGSQPSPGNTTAISTIFRVNGTTVERVRTHVFTVAIPIDPTKTLSTIELPNDGRVHLFGLSLA